jgi:hypothetical protein
MWEEQKKNLESVQKPENYDYPKNGKPRMNGGTEGVSLRIAAFLSRAAVGAAIFWRSSCPGKHA